MLWWGWGLLGRLRPVQEFAQRLAYGNEGAEEIGDGGRDAGGGLQEQDGRADRGENRGGHDVHGQARPYSDASGIAHSQKPANSR